MSLRFFLYLSLYVVLGCSCKATEIPDSQIIMDIRDKPLMNQAREHRCHLGLHVDESGTCVCPTNNYGGLLKCETSNTNHTPVVFLKRSYWLGYINNGTLVAGLCKFCDSFYANTTGKYIQLQDNHIQCIGHRNESSTLCSKCNNHFAVSMNSEKYECTKDPKNVPITISIYLFTQIFPITLLFLGLFFTNFGLVTGPLNAVIFFAQLFDKVFDLSGLGLIPVNNASKHWANIHEAHSIIYGIWNLHFFWPVLPNFCFSENISTIGILALNYIVAASPLLLIGLAIFIHWIGKRVNWTEWCHQIPLCWPNIDYSTSLGNVIASFILLSYTQFAVVTFYLLIPTPMYNAEGFVVTYKAYYDGSMTYFGKEHAPYVTVAILVSVFLIIFPIILLFFRAEGSHIFDKILKPFQVDFRCGCLCNLCRSWKVWKCSLGMGLHDYRWVSGKYFILRLFFLCLFTVAPGSVEVFLIECFVCMVESLFFLIFRPYKHFFYNFLDGIVFSLLAFISLLNMYQYFLTTNNMPLSETTLIFQCVFLYIPLVWIIGYIMFRIKRKIHCRLPQRHQPDNVIELQEDDFSYSSTDEKQLFTRSMPDYGTPLKIN